jgi:hypothetical protein
MTKSTSTGTSASSPVSRRGLWLKVGLVVAAVSMLIGGAYLYSQRYVLMHMTGMEMHHHGADGSGHDEVNMPGLRGANATKEESDELAVMFRNFDKITRSVINLPNGIRTVTSSQDDAIMAVLTSHVSGMINRVEEGDDPKIFIQSPTLDILFERRDQIKTEIETTEEGIIVVQTSDDLEVVKALHTHAAEVTDMANRGMQAVHESMMKRENH